MSFQNLGGRPSRNSEPELTPRNGHILMVCIVARISGCAKQKEQSLDDQVDHAKEAVRDLYDGPAEFHVIATKGKGERLDRPELEKIETQMRSGKYDLFVFDDLSRLIRGGEAARLLGVGVDNGTRSICLGDCIDTVEGSWEQDALNACSENVAHNERTSKRIKQKCMNRFRKHGGPTGRPIAGYIVPPDAKTYNEWLKNDALAPLIQEAKALLLKTLDCAIVADRFNEQNFPVGPYCRRKKWDGPMVRNFFGNPLLKGKPQRDTKHTVKHHGSGRRVSATNPKWPEYFSAPHLAHLTEEEFDELNALLNSKNACHRRPTVNGADPLFRRSRSDSRFPGMHSRCWYCGYHHVWGANGMSGNLMCSNSRAWQCWHSIGFSGKELVEKLVTAICNQLPCLDQLDQQFAAMVASAGANTESQFAEQWKQLRTDEAAFAAQKANLMATVKSLGPRPFFQAEIESLEALEIELRMRRHRLEQHRRSPLAIPELPAVLRGMLEEEFRRLAIESHAFGHLLRSLVPEIYVYSVRLCDGGHLLPRAKIKLNLGGTYPDTNLLAGLSDLLTQDLTVDLFSPPQRARIREEAVKFAADGFKPKAIAAKIAEIPSATAVQNALSLHSKMLSLGLESPYVTVLEPPEDYPKLRRHEHPRYQCKPLDGYQRPSL